MSKKNLSILIEVVAYIIVIVVFLLKITYNLDNILCIIVALIACVVCFFARKMRNDLKNKSNEVKKLKDVIIPKTELDYFVSDLLKGNNQEIVNLVMMLGLTTKESYDDTTDVLYYKLSYFNKKYKIILASDLTITLGDKKINIKDFKKGDIESLIKRYLNEALDKEVKKNK